MKKFFYVGGGTTPEKAVVALDTLSDEQVPAFFKKWLASKLSKEKYKGLEFLEVFMLEERLSIDDIQNIEKLNNCLDDSKDLIYEKIGLLLLHFTKRRLSDREKRIHWNQMIAIKKNKDAELERDLNRKEQYLHVLLGDLLIDDSDYKFKKKKIKGIFQFKLKIKKKRAEKVGVPHDIETYNLDQLLEILEYVNAYSKNLSL